MKKVLLKCLNMIERSTKMILKAMNVKDLNKLSLPSSSVEAMLEAEAPSCMAPAPWTPSLLLRRVHGVGGDSMMIGAAWAPSPTSETRAPQTGDWDRGVVSSGDGLLVGDGPTHGRMWLTPSDNNSFM